MVKNRAAFKRLIDRFSGTKILVIGDLMVDRFIRGNVSRISPEAPVPVVRVREEEDLPGGAGNVVMNLAALGARVSVCGVLGEDLVGDRLLRKFRESGIDTRWIKRDPTLSSILKTRVIAEHQQVVRFDHENDVLVSRSVQSSIQNSVPRMVGDANGVILSDYGKGLITKPLLTKSISFSKRSGKPVCVDPKLEHFLLYRNVTCITPNMTEALGGMHRVKLESKDGIRSLGFDILRRLKCDSVLITQGEKGMSLFERSRVTHIPAKAREVFDVTGAGDTVIGILTLSLACGASFAQAAALANLAAGIVVGKLGTATATRAELREALSWI